MFMIVNYILHNFRISWKFNNRQSRDTIRLETTRRTIENNNVIFIIIDFSAIVMGELRSRRREYSNGANHEPITRDLRQLIQLLIVELETSRDRRSKSSHYSSGVLRKDRTPPYTRTHVRVCCYWQGRYTRDNSYRTPLPLRALPNGSYGIACTHTNRRSRRRHCRPFHGLTFYVTRLRVTR